MKFRRRAVEVEAVQFEGFVEDTGDAVKNTWPKTWGTIPWTWHRCHWHRDHLVLGTWPEACPGDWVMFEDNGDGGDFVVYAPGSLARVYEPVEDAPPEREERRP